MTSVTQALSVLNRYPGISRATLEHAAEIGTLVHQHCLGTIMGYAVTAPDDLEKWVDPFKEWSSQMIDKVYGVELEVSDKDIQVVGHIDLACRLKKDSAACIIDLKRIAAKPDKAVGLQLAAYQYLCEKKLRRRFPHRYALHLKSDGKIALIPFVNPNDFPMFLSCLSIFNYLKGE